MVPLFPSRDTGILPESLSLQQYNLITHSGGYDTSTKNYITSVAIWQILMHRHTNQE